jgi:hypothetical protein
MSSRGSLRNVAGLLVYELYLATSLRALPPLPLPPPPLPPYLEAEAEAKAEAEAGKEPLPQLACLSTCLSISLARLLVYQLACLILRVLVYY